MKWILSLPLLLAMSADLAGQGTDRNVNDPAVRRTQGLAPGEQLLFNGWGLTPAGQQFPMSDLALKMIVSKDHKVVVAVCCGFNRTGLFVFQLKNPTATQFIPLAETWNGLAFSKEGRKLFVSGGDRGELHVFDYNDGTVKLAETRRLGSPGGPVFLAGMAVHPNTGQIYLCNEANHEIWVLQPDSLMIEARIPVGQHPHVCAFGGDRKHLYVSNWGSRSVSIIDTEKNQRVRDLKVGLRPNEMALSPDGRLFVAWSGDNTVHVIVTKAPERPGVEPSPTERLWEGTREIISTSLYPQSPEGSTPSAVAVSPDGKTLFVANSDNNNVMVVNITDDKTAMVEGFIPVGWYPTALAVSPDNKRLLVANGKGLKSRANFPARTDMPQKLHMPPQFDYIPRTLEGSLSVIERPDSRQMAAYTAQVRHNCPYEPEQLQRAPIPSNSIIPDEVGKPCPIKYVVYVIKENRTYDQVFGDFKDHNGKPAGNGDPRLTMYGENVTPNHHQLARDYVLLDNLYCNGEVSVDGHSWCDAAIATDFNQRSWIISYSKHGKLFGNDEMETPTAGYLWDLCKRHGVSFRNYGEGAYRVPNVNRGKWSGDRDTDRIKHWIHDLEEAEKTGVLPRFAIMSLGENHTRGTTPGAFTPDACVASNDQALGMMVEAATRSRFWKEMAIFVIEDDAQNGPDHVDAHRTVGFVISPYTKRRFVDSTLYTTASMIRTMELILGLPPLTQYDASATPMFNAFQKRAQLTSYSSRPPQVDLTAKNGTRAPFAKESKRMNFREYDRAPEDELNRILWFVAKGPGVPYPAPIHGAVFTK